MELKENQEKENEKKRNSNQKNEDQIRYKIKWNKMFMDEILKNKVKKASK